MHEKAQGIAATAKPIDTVKSENKGHNRSETRVVAVFDAAPAVAGTEWQGLVCAIVAVTRTTYKRDSKTGMWSASASRLLPIFSARSSEPLGRSHSCSLGHRKP